MTEVEKTAIEEFEEYVREGKYEKMKVREAFLKQAKLHLREEFEVLPGKRHVFQDINMVVKFVTKEIRETNHSSLIADALDYMRLDALVPLLSLNHKAIQSDELDKELAPYLLPTTYYVKPTLNKIGSSFVKKPDYLFGGQSPAELLQEVNSVRTELERLENEYERLKESLALQLQLIESEKKKLSSSVGSVSYIANQPEWDLEQIAKNYGEEFIIRYGKVDMGLLDEWVVSGKIPKSIVTKNRTVIDLRLDFIVIPLDVESKILNFHNNKRTKLSLRRYA